ncbi:MAG: hypothetical protein HYS14_01000 [Candidatus Rokubacteria bacterium]|nr:hypothetical protein [Candidatus Rokubacteria bacterium]
MSDFPPPCALATLENERESGPKPARVETAQRWRRKCQVNNVAEGVIDEQDEP